MSDKILLIPPANYSISPLNETALLVSFENCIDEAINERVIALQQAFINNPFKGFIETVAAYSSLAVFYDVAVVKNNNPVATTAFEFVKNITGQLMSEISQTPILPNNRIINIPVFYNGEDLDDVAKQHQLTVEEVIKIHIERTYRVYMIGFLPGFAYMGKVDKRIATPRHSRPRTNVPAGSVGIAGFQTGIYPLNSPGGWQLIGQTPLKIFDTKKEVPCLLKAGDFVQFVSINKKDLEKLNEY